MGSLVDVLNTFFSKHGFEIRKNKWFKKEKDSFIVCELQKSRFEIGSVYLNFGIVYLSLSKKKIRAPKGIDSWDLRGRLIGIIDKPGLNECLPLNIFHPDIMKKVEEIWLDIEQKGLPFLERYTDLEKLKEDLRNDTFDISRVLISVDSV